MNSTRNLASAALGKITPECQNLGRSIKLSSMVVLIMIIVAVILLVSAIIYNYMKKNDAPDAETIHATDDTKKKVVGALTITSTVIIFITAFAAIWQMQIASKAVRMCIPV